MGVYSCIEIGIGRNIGLGTYAAYNLPLLQVSWTYAMHPTYQVLRDIEKKKKHSNCLLDV